MLKARRRVRRDRRSTSLEMEGRFTICNLSVEMSARTAISTRTQTTMAYVSDALAAKGATQ